MAGIPPWRLWALTRSELVCALRGARARREQEHELAVFIAWRAATLQRAKHIPSLSRLLRRRSHVPPRERAEILADVAAAEVEFARLEAEARRRAEVQVDGR